MFIEAVFTIANKKKWQQFAHQETITQMLKIMWWNFNGWGNNHPGKRLEGNENSDYFWMGRAR